MIKRVLLVMAAALVFSAATPSYATFWNSHSGYNWSSQYNSNDCDDDRDQDYSFDWDWLNCDEPQQSNDCDWDRDWDCDWDWNWDCDWSWKDCDDKPRNDDCENPVPEPATAGLALMSLGALTAAVRRRK